MLKQTLLQKLNEEVVVVVVVVEGVTVLLLLDTHVLTHQMVQEGGLNKHHTYWQTDASRCPPNECLRGVKGSKLI